MTTGTLARRAFGAAFALMMMAPAVYAQTPAPETLRARYVEEIGGAAAIRAHDAFSATGTFSMAAAGISGPIEVYQDGGRQYSRITVPGIGELLRGFDGTTGWSINPLEGPRLLDGMELAQVREEATRGAALRDETVVTSMKTVEKTTMNGEECWLVQVVWKSGRETQDCYSIASGLIVGSTGTTTTPMGAFEYTTSFSDYREFGDIRIATRVVQVALGQEQVVTTGEVKFGPVADERFALPASIKALVK